MPPASAGSATRCLDCGTLVAAGTPEPAAADDAGAITGGGEYRTPFGRFLTQVQSDGRLAGGSRFTDPGDAGDRLDTLLGNLGPALKKAAGSGLAELRSYDRKKRQCVWSIPGKGGTPAPLAAAKLPLKPEVVRGVALKVGAGLRRLHRVGLAAYDLDPHLVFADGPIVTLVPTPWLASLARWGVGSPADMPYVAPEMAGEEPADPARADLYALGTLVMRLLTGADPAEFENRLPSEGSAKLAAWDVFVDGCRRSHPVRRFESVGQAMKAVPGERKGKLRPAPGTVPPPRPAAAPPPGDGLGGVTIDTSRPPRRKQGKLTRRAVLAGGAAALAGAGYAYRNQIGEMVPGASGIFSSYERGKAGTVITYDSRDYAGANWRRIGELNGGRGGTLTAVSGWNDDSVWCLHEHGGVFKLSPDGKELVTRLPDGNSASKYYDLASIEPGRLIACGKNAVYDITVAGVKRVASYGYLPLGRVLPVASDLYYVSRMHEGCVEVSGDDWRRFEKKKHKEMYVHEGDNTLADGIDLEDIVGIVAPKNTSAVGVMGESASSWGYRPWEVSHFRTAFVERRGEIWYKTGGCEFGPQGAWFFKTNGIWNAVIVGDEGEVAVQAVNADRGLRQKVTKVEEVTSMNLIAAWGSSPEKYWVMDLNGTVWERGGDGWRTVVRGLYVDDVEFNDFWVSPTGTVFAVDDDSVWKLG